MSDMVHLTPMFLIFKNVMVSISPINTDAVKEKYGTIKDVVAYILNM